MSGGRKGEGGGVVGRVLVNQVGPKGQRKMVEEAVEQEGEDDIDIVDKEGHKVEVRQIIESLGETESQVLARSVRMTFERSSFSNCPGRGHDAQGGQPAVVGRCFPAPQPALQPTGPGGPAQHLQCARHRLQGYQPQGGEAHQADGDHPGNQQLDRADGRSWTEESERTIHVAVEDRVSMDPRTTVQSDGQVQDHQWVLQQPQSTQLWDGKNAIPENGAP